MEAEPLSYTFVELKPDTLSNNTLVVVKAEALEDALTDTSAEEDTDTLLDTV